MFANFDRQPILKQMALLAGVGAGAFWLGSRVVASHDSAAAAHSVEPVHLVARAPEAGRTAGKERSFAPPRIEAAEADSAPGTPDTLVAKSGPADNAKPLEVMGHPHPTVSKRSHKRRVHHRSKPIDRGQDAFRHDDPYDNNDSGDESGPVVNGEPAEGYGDKPDRNRD